MGGDGFIQLAEVTVSLAEVGMSSRMVRVEGDSPADQFDREVMPTDLLGDDTEMVQRVGMVGLHG